MNEILTTLDGLVMFGPLLILTAIMAVGFAITR